MASTLTLTQCSPSSCRPGEWPLYQSCSTLAHTEDNGPYMISPQYSSPPPSPLFTCVTNKPVQMKVRCVHSAREVVKWGRPNTGYSSVKLGDGRTVTIGNLVPDDLPSPPTPSCFKRFIMKCRGMSGRWSIKLWNLGLHLFYDLLIYLKFEFFFKDLNNNIGLVPTS